MTLGQLLLDLSLALRQPIQDCVEVILVHRSQAQRLTQGTVPGLIPKAATRGQLGAWVDNLADDHGHCQVTLP